MLVLLHHPHRRLLWLLYVLLAVLAILLLADTAVAQPGWRLRRVAGAVAAARANVQAGLYPYSSAAYPPLPPPVFALPAFDAGGYLPRPPVPSWPPAANAPAAGAAASQADQRYQRRAAALSRRGFAAPPPDSGMNGPQLVSPAGESLPPAEPLPAAPAEPIGPRRGAAF